MIKTVMIPMYKSKNNKTILIIDYDEENKKVGVSNTMYGGGQIIWVESEDFFKKIEELKGK